MKNIRSNKGLINEVNDIRRMIRNLEENKHIPVQQLNEQPGPCGQACDGPDNGDCHPDCTCIELSDCTVDCCCGNEIVTIDGCLPGPCSSHADCGQTWEHCCYADASMMSLNFPSCNHPDNCYDYPPGISSTPNTEAGCKDDQALNYCDTCGIDNEECCYSTNSGCKSPMYINYCSNCDCDCTNNWVNVGMGNLTCCLVEVDPGGNPNQGGGGGYVTLGSLCFTEDSKVLMASGEEKKISDIELGEKVKSEIEESTVTGIDIHKGEFITYSINNSVDFVTSDHPFKTTEGWKSIKTLETLKNHGVESTSLQEGDILITKEGTEEVKSIKSSEEKTNIVYNLKLDNEHVYYVNGYLVHNAKSVDDDGTIGPDDGPSYKTAPGGGKNPKGNLYRKLKKRS